MQRTCRADSAILLQKRNPALGIATNTDAIIAADSASWRTLSKATTSRQESWSPNSQVDGIRSVSPAQAPIGERGPLRTTLVPLQPLVQ